jgi:hypothetical protein
MLALVVGLIIIGASMWAINHYIPMDKHIAHIFNIATIVLVVIWVLSYLGLF